MTTTAIPVFRERVTVVDVLETGACFEGVIDWVLKNRRIIAGDSSQYQDEHIDKTARKDGYGYGYGYGYGSGSGSGNGKYPMVML